MRPHVYTAHSFHVVGHFGVGRILAYWAPSAKREVHGTFSLRNMCFKFRTAAQDDAEMSDAPSNPPDGGDDDDDDGMDGLLSASGDEGEGDDFEEFWRQCQEEVDECEVVSPEKAQAASEQALQDGIVPEPEKPLREASQALMVIDDEDDDEAPPPTQKSPRVAADSQVPMEVTADSKGPMEVTADSQGPMEVTADSQVPNPDDAVGKGPEASAKDSKEAAFDLCKCGQSVDQCVCGRMRMLQKQAAALRAQIAARIL